MTAITFFAYSQENNRSQIPAHFTVSMIACVGGGFMDLASRFANWDDAAAALAPLRLAGPVTTTPRILATKAIEYFRDAIERGVAKVRSADWVFAGPGSPTFALAQWKGTSVPDAIVEIGLDVAVIPHYDNAEGGNHDTHFCYLGERRLAMLKPSLPDGCFALGIDGHCGLVMDLDADTAHIVGKGAVTLRRNGESVRIESGQTVPIDVLRSGGTNVPCVSPPDNVSSASTPASDLGLAPGQSQSSTARGASPPEVTELSSAAANAHEIAFTTALSERDADGAVAAILELESAIVEWSLDTLQSDDIDRAWAALRSMIVRLGACATGGVRDVRDVLGLVVEATLAARVVARSEKAFAVSDAIRDQLTAVGIEVRDTPAGAEWLIADA